MMTSEEILRVVNKGLESLAYDRKPASLYEPIRYVLSLGGKRIRPVLMLLGYNLFKEHPEEILMPALGLETYHNYTLLHDDLMDNADVRRGWCWPISVWPSVTMPILPRCLSCLRRLPLRLGKVSSLTWTSRHVMTWKRRNISR